MDNLTYELRALCRRNRDWSHVTQANRMTILTLVSDQLLEVGFRRIQATSLKRKHVEALPERWLAERLSPGTIKNRMAALRWWAQKVGNAGRFLRTMHHSVSPTADLSLTTTRHSTWTGGWTASPIRTSA
jgi:Phage integrase, N-terminal